MSVDPGNIGESSTECEVKDHAQSREECDATEAADQDESSESVKYSCTRNTLNGLDVYADGEAVVGQRGEVVREDADDNSSAAEFDGAEEKRDALESDTAESHCDGWTSVLVDVVVCLWTDVLNKKRKRRRGASTSIYSVSAKLHHSARSRLSTHHHLHHKVL